MSTLEKLGNRIGDSVDSFRHWLTSGSDLGALAKLVGVLVLATGAILGPFLYIADRNSEALERTMADLDNRPTVVFNAVAACVGKGYDRKSCELSRKAADDIASGWGTSLHYSTPEECAGAHRLCSKVTVMIPITTYVRDMPTTMYIPSTSYYPPVVAWQAAAGNLAEAVPLYSGPVPGTAVRRDGKQFTL